MADLPCYQKTLAFFWRFLCLEEWRTESLNGHASRIVNVAMNADKILSHKRQLHCFLSFHLVHVARESRKGEDFYESFARKLDQENYKITVYAPPERMCSKNHSTHAATGYRNYNNIIHVHDLVRTYCTTKQNSCPWFSPNLQPLKYLAGTTPY